MVRRGAHPGEGRPGAGFLAARRYRSLDGRPNYLCIYELEDVSVVDDPTYLQNYRSGTVTTERMKAKAKTFYRNVYIEIHAATDGIPLPPPMSDLDRRIRRLEDREEIRDLAVRYGFLVDERDVAGICAVHRRRRAAHEERPEQGPRHRGNRGVTSRAAFRVLGPTNHFTHGHLVDFDAGDPDPRATGMVFAHAEVVRAGVAMVTAMRYHDTYMPARPTAGGSVNASSPTCTSSPRPTTPRRSGIRCGCAARPTTGSRPTGRRPYVTGRSAASRSLRDRTASAVPYPGSTNSRPCSTTATICRAASSGAVESVSANCAGRPS